MFSPLSLLPAPLPPVGSTPIQQDNTAYDTAPSADGGTDGNEFNPLRAAQPQGAIQANNDLAGTDSCELDHNGQLTEANTNSEVEGAGDGSIGSNLLMGGADGGGLPMAVPMTNGLFDASNDASGMLQQLMSGGGGVSGGMMGSGMPPTTTPAPTPAPAPTTLTGGTGSGFGLPSTTDVVGASTTAGAVSSGAGGGIEQQAAELMNAERAKNGKPPLSVSIDLSSGSAGHSQTMVSSGNFEHAQDIQSGGEIIAMGTDMNVEQAIQGWIESPGHHEIMIGNYTEMGIGMAKGTDGNNYWTARFS